MTASTTGVYAGMAAFATGLTIYAGANGRLSDTKLGLTVPSEADRTKLYDGEILGTEIIHYPLTEGYGTIAHNVVTNMSPRLNGVMTTGNGWTNTQAFFKYNYNYGGTQINDYFFPNLNDKSNYFSPIYGIIEAGQSNAMDSWGATADLVGGDYAALNVAGTELQHILGYNTYLNVYGQISGEFYNPLFGQDDIIGYLLNAVGKDTFFIKKAEASTGLYPGSSANDWHPNTVGELFDTLNTLVSTVLTSLFIHGREPYVKDFIWEQGEKDAEDATWVAAYKDNLNLFFTKWKTELGNSSLNILIAQLGPFNTGVNRDSLRTAQASFVSENTNCSLINTSDFDDSDIHYGSADRVTLAEREYNVLETSNLLESQSYLNIILPGYTKKYYSPRK